MQQCGSVAIGKIFSDYFKSIHTTLNIASGI